MIHGSCDMCEGRTLGEGVPVGITCDCGRHFHIGAQLLIRSDRCIECPSCLFTVMPLALASPTEATEREDWSLEDQSQKRAENWTTKRTLPTEATE